MKTPPFNRTTAEKIKSSARLYINGLAGRLRELAQINLDSTQQLSTREDGYGHFKDFFQTFLDHTEECMILSSLAEETLALPDKLGLTLWTEHEKLEARYRKLQIFFLKMVTKTLSALLAIWRQRLAAGYGLAYGSYETFLLAQRIIAEIKNQISRPRFEGELDDDLLPALQTAEETVALLLSNSPRLREFRDADPKSAAPQKRTDLFADDFASARIDDEDDEA